jgi:hypothetical protein
MKSLINALFRAIARAIATEAGELMSVRRKYHLLQSEIYSPAEDVARRQSLRQSNRPEPVALQRCHGARRHLHLIARRSAA